MKARLTLLSLICAASLLASSCTTVEKLVRRGDAAFELGEYAAAADYYKRAYSRTPSREREKRGAIAYKLGDAYRRYGYVARAVGAFRNAERYGQTDTLTYLRLGDCLMGMADYKGAGQSYTAYLEQHPDDSLAMAALDASRKAADIKAAGSAYTVREAKTFNSYRSDYCPALLGDNADRLYFTTTRPQVTGDKESDITDMMPGDIYFSKKDENGVWQRPEPVEGGLNTAYDEGACSFSPDGQTMYLTVCRSDAQWPRMAEIWTSARADAAWSQPQQLTITSDTLSSYAHPAPSPDGRWLYFASDMPGGYGGVDIWRARFDGHGIGMVENLGPDINTEGNEMFPAFRPSGELYFSSDGRGGLGGLDLYAAVEDTLTQRWLVRHLPAPMNSNGDDFGITFEGVHNRGFFSSSRSTGGRGWDKIYEFEYPEVLQTVKGWVYEQDGYELPEALVYMVGNDGTYLKITPMPDGSFVQPVQPGVDYVFLATCEGYLNYRNSLSPDSTTQPHEYVLQFPLPSTSAPVLVRNVFYAFDQADILPESIDALDRLVALLAENPNVTIELSAHCDYRGNDEYNEKLSQRRAESVVRYIAEHGIDTARLTAKGYGKAQPKVVNKRLAEIYPFLHENDTLTEQRILELPPEEQETCNALNRRTQFRVLRTTYGLFDEQGRLKVDALTPTRPSGADEQPDSENSQPDSQNNQPTKENAPSETESDSPAEESEQPTAEDNPADTEDNTPAEESEQPTEEDNPADTEGDSPAEESEQPTAEDSQPDTENEDTTRTQT